MLSKQTHYREEKILLIFSEIWNMFHKHCLCYYEIESWIMEQEICFICGVKIGRGNRSEVGSQEKMEKLISVSNTVEHSRYQYSRTKSVHPPIITSGLASAFRGSELILKAKLTSFLKSSLLITLELIYHIIFSGELFPGPLSPPKPALVGVWGYPQRKTDIIF